MHKIRSKHPEYTILLPTYNERENIGLIIWLIFKYLRERQVGISLADLMHL